MVNIQKWDSKHKGAITGVTIKIITKTFPRDYSPILHVSKSCKESKTRRLPCGMHSRIASDGPRKTCLVLFMDHRFFYKESLNFSSQFFTDEARFHLSGHKLSKHAYMGSRKPSYCAWTAFAFTKNRSVVWRIS